MPRPHDVDDLFGTHRLARLTSGFPLARAWPWWAATVLGYRAFLVLTFDERKAQVLGLRPRAAQAALLGLVALAVIASFQTVGALLVFALLVGPAASAALIVRRVPAMMALAAVLSWTVVVIGLLASYHASIAAGGTIAVTAILQFFVVSAIQGIARSRGDKGRILGQGPHHELVNDCPHYRGLSDAQLMQIRSTAEEDAGISFEPEPFTTLSTFVTGVPGGCAAFLRTCHSRQLCLQVATPSTRSRCDTASSGGYGPCDGCWSTLTPEVAPAELRGRAC